MQYYRCKCGDRTAYGSMPPPACARCLGCQSNLATSPHTHAEPEPHSYITEHVQTSRGPMPRERCRYCLALKVEIEAGID